MQANIRKSDASWKRMQSRAHARTFANRSDAVIRAGIARKVK